MCKFLVVEDDKALRDIIAHRLRELDQKVEALDTVAGAKERIKRNNIDCIILDLQLVDGNGTEVLEYIRDLDKYIPTLVITAANEPRIPKYAINHGFIDVVTKPFVAEKLIQAARRAVKAHEESKRLNNAISSLESTMDDTQFMRSVE